MRAQPGSEFMNDAAGFLGSAERTTIPNAPTRPTKAQNKQMPARSQLRFHSLKTCLMSQHRNEGGLLLTYFERKMSLYSPDEERKDQVALIYESPISSTREAVARQLTREI